MSSGEHKPGSAAAPLPGRLEILGTEYYGLLASRSLAWNEAFTRASMFLTVLTGSVVALALLAQGFGFGRTFAAFALAILPIVLLVGITTFLRLGAVNHHDLTCVVGMNRIRHAYLEIAPELEPYLVMGHHDDHRGAAVTMATPPGQGRIAQLLVSTGVVVGVLSAVVAGVIGALAAYLARWGGAAVGVIGAVVFLGVLAALARQSAKRISREWDSLEPLFPSPGA